MFSRRDNRKLYLKSKQGKRVSQQSAQPLSSKAEALYTRNETPGADETVSLNLRKYKPRIMEFNTNEYQFSHGRMPKGTGHWMFKIGATEVSFTNMTYGEAKKAARKIVREEFAPKARPIIIVLP